VRAAAIVISESALKVLEERLGASDKAKEAVA